VTALEIKSEIKKTIDELHESSLAEVLNLLKDLQQYPSVDIASVYPLKQIIAENRRLLEKLAQ
jgi:Ni,Fe-hydrogenase maturation factor